MLIDKKDLPIVDMDFMNDVHLEDIDIINTLFEAVKTYDNDKTEENKQAINQQYEAWIEHTKAHFKGEEVMMLEKNFGPYAMHKGEHDNALRQMQEVFTQWQQTQEVAILKIYLIEHVPSWFVQHIASMDTVTARFFKTGMSPCSI